MFDVWVFDASLPEYTEGMRAYCPYNPATEDVIIGLTVIAEYPPDGCLWGVFHPEGPEAAKAFVNEHPELIESLFGHTDVRCVGDIHA
jgi:hypothetical protein